MKTSTIYPFQNKTKQNLWACITRHGVGKTRNDMLPDNVAQFSIFLYRVSAVGDFLNVAIFKCRMFYDGQELK